MINSDKIARQICLLRKEKGLSQEMLAEKLSVSPQAVSKWENGKALHETATLPLLARALGCSIDSILMPQELYILSAVYTDGENSADTTQLLNGLIMGNAINIPVSGQIFQNLLTGDRVKYLVVKYQNPIGIFYTYTVKGDCFSIDVHSKGYEAKNSGLEYLFAVYGNESVNMDVIQKLKHYEYFKWDGFHANHEMFFSPPENDGEDFLSS